jgi:hypothetical protein
LMHWSQKWFLKNKKYIILMHFDTKKHFKKQSQPHSKQVTNSGSLDE